MLDNLEYNKCHFCGKTVEIREMEMDYHKGWHIVDRKKVYPYEERTFEFPEGRLWHIIVCQDCIDKPTSEWIHKLRIETIKKELERIPKLRERMEKQETYIKNKLNLLEESKTLLIKYLYELENKYKTTNDWETVKIPKMCDEI